MASSPEKGAWQWDWLMLHLPIFGPLFRKVALSRFSKTCATMIQKFFVAFIPVFVAIDPIGLVAIYMGLASSASPEQRKRQASLGIFTAF